MFLRTLLSTSVASVTLSLLPLMTFALEPTQTPTETPTPAITVDFQTAWSTYLGGGARDEAWGAAMDAQGNVFAVGFTESNAWVSGGPRTIRRGGRDAFLAKMNLAGGHVWSTYIGGHSFDSGYGITLDDAGNIYVVGDTISSGWISGGYKTTYGGVHDGFLVKMNTSGERIWSTYLGGNQWDAGTAVAVDLDGNVYAAGRTESAGWISGGHDTTHNGGSDAYVVKLSPNGAHLWSTYLGGSGYEALGEVATDSLGNVIVVGRTESTSWGTQGVSFSLNGSSTGFVVKLDPMGNLLWAIPLGGSEFDATSAVRIDALDNILVAGTTDSTDWASGGFQTTHSGVRDAYVAKLSPDGDHIWSTYLGGSDSDVGQGIAVQANGEIVVTGHTESDGWVAGGPLTSLPGASAAFVARLDPDGEHIWSTYLGGEGSERCHAVAGVDGLRIAVVGNTTSADWIAGGHDTSYGGSGDGFALLLQDTSVLPIPTSTPTATPTGTTVVLTSVAAGDPCEDETFTVAVSVENNDAIIASYAVRLRFDPAQIRYVEGSAMDAGDGMNVMPDELLDQVALGIVDLTAMNFGSAFREGRILLCDFEVLDTGDQEGISIGVGKYGVSGLVSITFTPIPHDYDASGTAYLCGVAPTPTETNTPSHSPTPTITPTPSFLWGDLNDDAVTGTVDASLILRFDTFVLDHFPCCPEVYPDFPLRADVNGDGLVGTLDAALILKYDTFMVDCFPADTNCDGVGPEEDD